MVLSSSKLFLMGHNPSCPGSWRNSMTESACLQTVATISDAVRWAEEIMREIDSR
jgi:hypothetical protein